MFTSNFPSAIQPVHGIFVKERVRFVSQLPGVEVRVVSPTPYFPPIKWFSRWYPWSQIPMEETIDGLRISRSRYFLPPKLGGYFHPRLMYRAARRAVEKVGQEFDFDLIDSHFAYPSGVVATMLGQLYDKPVVITGRGEDIERFPHLPLVGNQIRWALGRATRLVAVSKRIAEQMEQNGGDPDRITVIANGVDFEKFQPVSREQSRRTLRLPQDRKIILAVGYRLELKGYHLLIDALAKIRRHVPEAMVAIVGGQARWANDYLPAIEERIRAHNLADHVIVAGTRPQSELSDWYSASDVLSILSSREGSPNVLMEALCCGLPAVATRVGGIPDILADSRLGILLPERSADAAATGLTEALSRTWDRPAIRHAMEGRSWHETAKQVDSVFDLALAEYESRKNA